jgi:hypothetical protein
MMGDRMRILHHSGKSAAAVGPCCVRRSYSRSGGPMSGDVYRSSKNATAGSAVCTGHVVADALLQ